MEDLTFVSTIAIFAAFAVTGITLYVLSQPEDNPNQDNNSNMSKRKNAHIESPKNTKSSKQSHHYLQSSPSTTPTTTSKGTSRSYFHREVTPEEDRDLLDDSTPSHKHTSRVNINTDTPSRNDMIKSNHSTSTSTRIFSPSPHASRVQELQWHSGGNTWEERSYSKWGKTRLKEILENIIIQFPEKLGLVKVTEVSHIEGDASVIQIRGRNKLIYDFSLHVLWKGTFRGSDKKVLEGKFIISEITGDCMYDIKSQIPHYNIKMLEKQRQLIDQYILSSTQGIRKEIVESLHQFLRDFQNFNKCK